jgi:hypothetical protein
MQFWLDFVYLITNNEYFRAGFISGLVLVGLIWLIWGLFFRVYVQWLKIRQFFEPIKTPARAPTVAGPSPASMLLGCLWRIVIVLLALVVAVVLLFALRPG